MKKHFILISLISLSFLGSLPIWFHLVRADPFTQYMVWDWENNCDEWGGFWFPISASYPNGRSGENSTAQFVNGSYSLYFKADANLGADGWYGIKSNGTIPTYDWNFYFWIYMSSVAPAGSYTGLVCGLSRGTPETYWLVGFEPEGTGFRVGAYVGNDGWKTSERFTYNATPTIFTMATWYAFRLNHNYTASECLLYWSTDAITWNYEGVSVNWLSTIPIYFRLDHQDNCHVYYGYTDFWVVTDTEEMYEPYVPPPPEYWYPLRTILGLIGILFIILSPTLTIKEVYSNKNYGFLITAFLLLAFGYALIVCWLIP